MSKKKPTPRPASVPPAAPPVLPVLDRQAKPLAREELPAVLTEAETAELLASAPAGIAPRTPDNPAGLLTEPDEPPTGRYPSGVPPYDGHAAKADAALERAQRRIAEYHGELDPEDVMLPAPALHPIGKRGDKGFVWELDGTWTERVERMASVAGVPPQGFLEGLLRRAWVGLDRQQRGRLP